MRIPIIGGTGNISTAVWRLLDAAPDRIAKGCDVR
jgi:hypothetical protein